MIRSKNIGSRRLLSAGSLNCIERRIAENEEERIEIISNIKYTALRYYRHNNR